MEIRGSKLPTIELVRFTKEKDEEYKSFMPYLYEELDKYEEATGKEEVIKYILLKVNGKERLIQFIGPYCVEYYLVGDLLYTRYLELDENYRVKHACYEGYEVVEDENKLLIIDCETGIIQDFDYNLNGYTDEEGYNATAMYSQYDQKKDTKLYLIYPLIDRKDGRMYSMHLNEPTRLIFLNNASKQVNKEINFKKMQAYVKYDFDYDAAYPYYNLVTVREYGVLRTMQEGAANLQMVNPLTRYFRMNGLDSNNRIKVSFALGEYLTPEQIDDKLKEHKYKKEVPDYIIDMYNGDNVDYFIDCCIAETIRGIDMDYQKKTGKSLLYVNKGVQNEGN